MSTYMYARGGSVENVEELLQNPLMRVFYCPNCGRYFAVPRGVGPVNRCVSCGYPHVVRVDTNRGFGWRGRGWGGGRGRWVIR